MNQGDDVVDRRRDRRRELLGEGLYVLRLYGVGDDLGRHLIAELLPELKNGADAKGVLGRTLRFLLRRPLRGDGSGSSGVVCGSSSAVSAAGWTSIPVPKSTSKAEYTQK